ncbi:hypothetical protein [Helicobacter apodemus]|nr:hypothetical protein [Helicobacter apodemus]
MSMIIGKKSIYSPKYYYVKDGFIYLKKSHNIIDTFVRISPTKKEK